VRTDCPSPRLDGVEAVADAILYEGYLLYPYRRSSVKNRVRWQFGVLVPPAWAAAHGLVDSGVAGSAESPWQQTACLVEAPDTATVLIRLRFLHLQRKVAETRTADGGYRPVDRIEVGGRTGLSFDATWSATASRARSSSPPPSSPTVSRPRSRAVVRPRRRASAR
jgi:hypothetical protein